MLRAGMTPSVTHASSPSVRRNPSASRHLFLAVLSRSHQAGAVHGGAWRICRNFSARRLSHGLKDVSLRLSSLHHRPVRSTADELLGSSDFFLAELELDKEDGIVQHSETVSDGVFDQEATSSSSSTTRAAFLDMDGTLVKSNVVLPFVIQRLRELPFLFLLLWVPYYAVKGVVYKILDRVDRSLFTKAFYRDYKGRDASESAKAEMAERTNDEYFLPRVFPAAKERISELKEDGFLIVLVTGSLDFLVKPFARSLGIDHVIASRLEEREGSFTGELVGKPLAGEEKKRKMEEFAEDYGVDLGTSHAYGDSIADLGMFQAAGVPHAVSPDSRLRSMAGDNGWPVLEWAV